MARMREFLTGDSGVTSIEYGLFVACLGVWCVVALEAFGLLPALWQS